MSTKPLLLLLLLVLVLLPHLKCPWATCPWLRMFMPMKVSIEFFWRVGCWCRCSTMAYEIGLSPELSSTATTEPVTRTPRPSSNPWTPTLLSILNLKRQFSALKSRKKTRYRRLKVGHKGSFFRLGELSWRRIQRAGLEEGKTRMRI